MIDLTKYDRTNRALQRSRDEAAFHANGGRSGGAAASASAAAGSAGDKQSGAAGGSTSRAAILQAAVEGARTRSKDRMRSTVLKFQ